MQQVGMNNLSVRLRITMDDGALKGRSKRGRYLPTEATALTGPVIVRSAAFLVQTGILPCLTVDALHWESLGRWDGSLARLTRQGMTSLPKVLRWWYRLSSRELETSLISRYRQLYTPYVDCVSPKTCPATNDQET